MMPPVTSDSHTQSAEARKVHVLLEAVTRLLHRKAEPAIRKILAKTHSADIIALLEELELDYVLPVFCAIESRSAAASVLVRLSGERRDAVLEQIGSDLLRVIVREAPPDELTDFVANLSAEQASRIMTLLGVKERGEVTALSQYDPDSAGGLMTSDFFALEQCVPVSRAIEELQKQDHVEMVFYLYVIDDDGHLVGVVSLRDLLLAKPTAQLAELMRTRVVAVAVTAAREEVARLTDRYRLLALPVVDAEGVLLGMVTVDDVLEVIADQATQDMLRMAGTDSMETQVHSPLRIFRFRVPWLMAAFMGGIGAAGVVDSFESTLSQVIQLSAFLPIIMGMAGNVGTQAATVTVRGLAVGLIREGNIAALLWKEMSVGVLLGVFYGVCLAAVSWFMFHSLPLVQTVGITIMVNICAAAFIATVLPLFFHRVGADPALAAGPFVLTAVDVLGVVNYLIIATLIFGL